MNNDKRLDEFFENKLKGGENYRLFQTEVEISKEDAEEIASLLSFAATIEEVLHPRPSPAATGAARARLLDIAKEIQKIKPF